MTIRELYRAFDNASFSTAVVVVGAAKVEYNGLFISLPIKLEDAKVAYFRWNERKNEVTVYLNIDN